MENSEQKRSLRESTEQQVLDSFKREERKRRLIGLLRVIAGIVISIVAVKISMGGSAIFYGAVIFGLYWVVIGGIEIFA